MVYAAQIAGHIVITLVAMFGLALRIEHRLTKIETDVAWLKNHNNQGCERPGEKEDVSDAWRRNSLNVFNEPSQPPGRKRD